MPATGNPQGADAPNVPTAAQLTALAALQSTETTAIATYHSARLSYKTAHAAMLQAQAAVVQYQAYIAGGQKPGIIDEGGPSIT
jgi:hypothetical protein